MKKRFNRSNVLAVAFLTYASTSFADNAAPVDLRKDFSALSQYIKRTDYMFGLVECKNELIGRMQKKGITYFSYSAVCAINPQPHEGCQAYSVTSSGTVDTPTRATVKETRLKLLCSTEGRGEG
jgi:hypothetical protein